MKLYRSLGRIWSGTQADAKKAQDGKDFEEIDVPTDKPGLMAFLNTFDVRPGDVPRSVHELETLDQVMAELGDELDEMLGGGEPATVLTATRGPGSARAATSCPACQRDAKVASMVVNAEASINIRADIEDVMELETVDDLIARLQRRRAEIFDMERGNDAEEMLG